MNTAMQLLLMGGRFDPSRHFFGSTDVGDWWDPSDLPLMYQDSAGTTAAAVNQPVGLMLGQRFKGQRGAEQFVNGDLSSGTAGYTAGNSANLSAAGNLLTVTNTIAQAGSAYQTFATVPGQWYVFTFSNFTTGTDARVSVNDGPVIAYSGSIYAAAVSSGSGKTVYFRASGAQTSVGVYTNSTVVGVSTVWGGLSLMAVPGIHRYQTTSANRPTLKQDANGKYYLSYNGTNSWMQTSAVDFTGTDKVTICGAWTKLSDAARGIILELGAASPSFRVDAPTSPGAAQFGFASSGTGGSAFVGPIGYPAPFAAVLTCQGDIASDGCSIRVNGALGSSAATDQGTGNYRNDVLYWGSRSGTSLFFNGNEYISAIKGGAATESLIARMERECASRPGITL